MYISQMTDEQYQSIFPGKKRASLELLQRVLSRLQPTNLDMDQYQK